MKTIILSIIGLVLLGGGGWVYMNYTKYTPKVYIQESPAVTTGTEEKVLGESTNSASTQPATTTATPESPKTTVTTINTETGETTAGAPMYTMAEVSTHADASSCYTVINNVVYDLTMWVNLHPGGKGPITFMCGKDGTTSFMNKHKGAQKQMDILARYKIGLLTQ